MKSLSDTSVFRYTELVSTSKITDCLKLLIDPKKGAEFIEEDMIEDVLYKIRHKSFNYSAKFKLLELYRKGKIRLVYNPRVKLTVAIPFFKFKTPDNDYGIIINLSTYAKKEKDGTFKVDHTLLYGLMLSGTLSLISDKYMNLIGTPSLVQLYGDLVVNVLAKLVNVDQMRREVYKFIFTKFMYIQIGYTDERATESAKTGVSLDNVSLEKIDLSCPNAAFANLETLIDHLRKIFTDTNNLTLGFLFDKWMRTYGEATAFAIEDPISFVTLFIALIINASNMINVKAIEHNANRTSSKLVVLFNKFEGVINDII